MEAQTDSASPLPPTQEQLREAAPDLYEACKLALDRNRSGYSLFSHRATVALEAAVAKAVGRRSSRRNEFSKEHRNVAKQQTTLAEQESTIAELKTTVAQQQKQIEALTTTIRKVSERS